MSQKHHHQAYQALPTEAAAMDNPAMSNSSSSSGSNDNVAGLEPLGLPATYSSQQLVSSDSDSMARLRESETQTAPGEHRIGKREWITVAVLCFVNLINYMDRFTIAGKCNEFNSINRESQARQGGRLGGRGRAEICEECREVRPACNALIDSLSLIEVK